MKRKLLLLSILVSGALASNAQWNIQAAGFSAASRGINNIHAVDSNIVWAVAYDGTSANLKVREFTRTNNAGATWNPGKITGTGVVSTMEIANISAVDFDTAYASLYPNTGTAQGIFKTTDGGTTWTKLVTGYTTASFVNVVHMFNAKDGFAQGDPVGGYFELYTTSNYGNSWTRVPQANIPAPLSGEYGIVGYFSALDSTIRFSTNKSRIYKSTDLGMTWTVSTTPVPVTANGVSIPALAFKDAMNGLAVASNDDGSYILTTSDGGDNWVILNDSTAGDVYNWNDISYVPGTAGTYFITSAHFDTSDPNVGGKGSSYSTNDGNSWTNIDKEQRTAVAFANINNGWAGAFSTNATTGGLFKWGAPATVGVNSVKKDNKAILVFPNPTNNGVISLQIKADDVNARVRVYDLMGRVVLAENVTAATATLDLSAQAKGMYIVEVSNNGVISAQKLVIE